MKRSVTAWHGTYAGRPVVVEWGCDERRYHCSAICPDTIQLASCGTLRPPSIATQRERWDQATALMSDVLATWLGIVER